MQNKPNFENDKMNINTIVTMCYVILYHWLRRKNKAKNKANSNPTCRGVAPNEAGSKHVLSGVEWANFKKFLHDKTCLFPHAPTMIIMELPETFLED
jgi:hypothetical protein